MAKSDGTTAPGKVVGKQELIRRVADRSGHTQKDTEAFLNGLISVVTDALAMGEEVRLTGFGTFRSRLTVARSGKDPRTGAPITVPAHRVARFSAGKELRTAVEQGRQ
jgi:DNA-binding protein HU-beta